MASVLPQAAPASNPTSARPNIAESSAHCFNERLRLAPTRSGRAVRVFHVKHAHAHVRPHLQADRQGLGQRAAAGAEWCIRSPFLRTTLVSGARLRAHLGATLKFDHEFALRISRHLMPHVFFHQSSGANACTGFLSCWQGPLTSTRLPKPLSVHLGTSPGWPSTEPTVSNTASELAPWKQLATPICLRGAPFTSCIVTGPHRPFSAETTARVPCHSLKPGRALVVFDPRSTAWSRGDLPPCERPSSQARA
jgi:hypothetical protein